MRAAIWRMAVPGVLLALLVGWYAWPEPEEPTVPVDQAQHRIEAELADVAGAFHPGLQWAVARYESDPDLTGLCGTSGCKRTGRAEMSARQAARVRITPTRNQEPLDVVQALWTGKGYSVERNKGSVEVKGSGFSLRFVSGVEGCAEVWASVFNVTDIGDREWIDRFGPGGQAYAATCATVDDPYWSH
ncbi:hypothetical protein [Kitasatospora sp. NPDC001095]